MRSDRGYVEDRGVCHNKRVESSISDNLQDHEGS